MMRKVFSALFSVVVCMFLFGSLHAEEPQGVPPLRVVYFTPADQEAAPDREERIGRVMKNIQDFYRKGMEENGFGPKTFALEWESPGKLRLYDVKGKKNLHDYPKGSEYAVYQEVEEALKTRGIDISREFVLVLGVFLEWKNGVATEYGPYSGGGGLYGGFAFACEDPLLDAELLSSRESGAFHYMVGHCSKGMFNTLYIGGIAHELGHCFALPHDCERDSQKNSHGVSLMGVGNHFYGKASRGEGHDAFLSPASALRLSVSRAFDPDFDGQKTMEILENLESGQWNIDPFEVSFSEGKIVLQGKCGENPLPRGLIVYNDNMLREGDYDAKTWVVSPGESGDFRFEIDELDHVPYEMKWAVVFPGAVAEILKVEYSNMSGTPDLAPLSSGLAHRKVKTLLDRKAWTELLEVLEKQVESQPNVPSWARKLKHVRFLQSPPELVDLTTVPQETETFDLCAAKAIQEKVGWYEPGRNVLRECGFLEIDGMFFESGIYAHPDSLYTFPLEKKWKEFRFAYGIQDEKPGSVVFIVRGDGRELFRSKTVKRNELHLRVLNVSGVERLELITEDSGDGWANDWGLWIEPRLSR